MKVISIIGFGAKDFWTIGFPNSRFSQVNHFIDKPGLALDYSNIGILKYNTGIDNYPITHMSAVSNNDIWFVGYGGIAFITTERISKYIDNHPHHQSKAMQAPTKGNLVDTYIGKYRVTRELGRAAMGLSMR